MSPFTLLQFCCLSCFLFFHTFSTIPSMFRLYSPYVASAVDVYCLENIVFLSLPCNSLCCCHLLYLSAAFPEAAYCRTCSLCSFSINFLLGMFFLSQPLHLSCLFPPHCHLNHCWCSSLGLFLGAKVMLYSAHSILLYQIALLLAAIYIQKNVPSFPDQLKN